MKPFLPETPARTWFVPRILGAIALVSLLVSAEAGTEKYRLTWRADPATTMVVGWHQSSGSNPVVYYDTTDHGTNTGSYAFTKTPDRSVTAKGLSNQFARLSGLSPDTEYFFVIGDSDSTSARYRFHTAPSTPQPFTYVAGGDSRNNRTPRQNGNRLVAKLRPLFVAFGGDYTNGDTSGEWADWFDDWQLTTGPDGRMIPIVATRGNHEGSNATIVDLFDVPHADAYFALTFGGNLLRLYTLNSEFNEGGAQATWLDGDLAANTGVTWKAAQYHKPMRPHTSSKSEGTGEYNAWSGIFFNRGMDLVVECDSHLVKRTYPVRPDTGAGSDEGFIRDDANGTLYIGEGCWGAPLRPADDEKDWTIESDSFNQVKWIEVTSASVKMRSVRSDNALAVGGVAAMNSFDPPAHLDLWRPATGGDTVTLPFVAPSTLSPTCAAGPDTTVAPAALAFLDGSVTDDGPLPAVTRSWTKVSGPGEVYFYDPDESDTNADFGALGDYVLRLTVDDGEITAFDDVNVTVTGGGTSTFEVRVASGDDDAEENNAGGAVNLTSTDLELIDDSSSGKLQTVGMRFFPAVPQGATITDAWIQFTVDETGSTTTNVTFRGQDSDDAPTFTTGNSDISNRPVTSANVAWNPPAWNTVGEAGPDQQTPDLSAVVQEVVDRPGWSTGNGMVFIVTGAGKRTAESYNGSSSQAALLHVEYEVAVTALNLWNFTHFTPTQRADTGVSAPTANPDGDPYANLAEFAFDLSPLQANTGVVTVSIVDDAGTPYPAIVYPRRKGGSGTNGVDYVADGVTYRVLTAPGLDGLWSGGPSIVEGFSVSDDGNGVTETVEIRSEIPLSTPPDHAEYFRLMLEQP